MISLTSLDFLIRRFPILRIVLAGLLLLSYSVRRLHATPIFDPRDGQVPHPLRLIRFRLDHRGEAQDLLTRVEVDALEHRVHGVREQSAADQHVVQRDIGFEEDGREELGREAQQHRDIGLSEAWMVRLALERCVSSSPCSPWSSERVARAS